jgi:hypothetical protein
VEARSGRSRATTGVWFGIGQVWNTHEPHTSYNSACSTGHGERCTCTGLRAIIHAVLHSARAPPPGEHPRCRLPHPMGGEVHAQLGAQRRRHATASRRVCAAVHARAPCREGVHHGGACRARRQGRRRHGWARGRATCWVVAVLAAAAGGRRRRRTRRRAAMVVARHRRRHRRRRGAKRANGAGRATGARRRRWRGRPSPRAAAKGWVEKG